MKEKPYMSALQKELLAEINKHPKKGDASRLLRLHPGFEGLNPSTIFRWLQKKGDHGQAVEGRIRAVIQILKKELPANSLSVNKKCAFLVELDRILMLLSQGDHENIRPLLEGLLGSGREKITIPDLVFLMKTEKTLGLKITASLAKELLDAERDGKVSTE